MAVGHQRNRNVRTDHHAGQQVAQHDRLLEPLKEDRGDGGGAQHQGQGLKKVVCVVHAFLNISVTRNGGVERTYIVKSKPWQLQVVAESAEIVATTPGTARAAVHPRAVLSAPLRLLQFYFGRRPR